MSSLEIFYLYICDRAFHIFFCKKNPSSYAEAHVIESLDSGKMLTHRGSMGVFTGSSQGIYLLLCQFASDERHSLAEKYYLRNEINASMDNMAQIDPANFLGSFTKHSTDFQEHAYKIVRQYDPLLASEIEALVDSHWQGKAA